MTTLQTHGGGAQPASIDTSGKVAGGAALRVYGFDSEADAIAAGYVCAGGPAMSVALITDAQIASGEWKVEGDPSGAAVYTAPASMLVEGGYAVPVYPVNGWGSAPAPVAPLILDLQADQLALSDNAPVSTWNDLSGYGHNFTQVGNARPTFVAADERGYPAIYFDGIDDWMHGSDFADNLDNFTVIMVGDAGPAMTITKMNNKSTGAGWAFYAGGTIGLIQEAGGNNWIEKDAIDYPILFSLVSTLQVVSKSEIHLYLNGSAVYEVDFSNPPIGDYSSSESICLGVFSSLAVFNEGYINAVRIYTPALDAASRAAVEAELAARYGMTLP